MTIPHQIMSDSIIVRFDPRSRETRSKISAPANAASCGDTEDDDEKRIVRRQSLRGKKFVRDEHRRLGDHSLDAVVVEQVRDQEKHRIAKPTQFLQRFPYLPNPTVTRFLSCGTTLSAARDFKVRKVMTAKDTPPQRRIKKRDPNCESGGDPKPAVRVFQEDQIENEN
jgi:hypothetical protein